MNVSSKALLSGLIDYAGLFPPAGLGMAEVVREYARVLGSPFRFAVGRFVVPAGRLGELAEGAPKRGEAWRVSVLVEDPSKAAAGLAEFEAAEAGRFVIDAVETKALDAGEDASGRTVFVEMPAEFAGALDRLSRRPGMRAKIRTGGLTAEAIPSVEWVAAFLVRSAMRRAPFKATAGLHHPVRGEYALTYEPGSARVVMHGFLNVFLAAACAWFGQSEAVVRRILEERDAGEFRFSEGFVRCCGVSLTSQQVEEARRSFALSFGSCSVEDPERGLRAMGLPGVGEW
jgi:hypothetical protein